MLSHKVGLILYFLTSIRDRNGESATAHDREIHNIVAHEGDVFVLGVFCRHDFFQCLKLVVLSLKDVVQFEIAGAESHRFGPALGDDTQLQTSEASKRHAYAI